MSELSKEEKLINYLNSIDITRVFYDNPPHDNHVGIGKAIQGLLDLYQKEKQKNKELENADLTTVYMNGFYDGEKKWKDKINEKIADYTEKAKIPLVNSQSIREYTFGIRAFQRLLEERNKDI